MLIFINDAFLFSFNTHRALYHTSSVVNNLDRPAYKIENLFLFIVAWNLLPILSVVKNFTGKKVLLTGCYGPLAHHILEELNLRSVFDEIAPNLSGIGFKILLDIFASSKKKIKYQEINFSFRKQNLINETFSFKLYCIGLPIVKQINFFYFGFSNDRS